MKKTTWIWIVIVIVVLILGFVAFYYRSASLVVPLEGTVSYSDCRQIITIQETNESYWAGYFGKQFTCNYIKTQSGKIMGGNCVLVNLDTNGNCVSAYVYQAQQDNVCPAPDPYLGYNDMCYSTSQL